MRFKIWLGLLAVGLLIVGGGRTFIYFTNLSPTKMSLSAYLQSRPSAKWVTFTDCEADFDEMAQLESLILKKNLGVAIPLRPAGAPEGIPADVIMLITDEVQTQLLASALSGSKNASSAEITGTVMGAFDTNEDKYRDAIKRSRIAQKDFVIIEYGRKPDLSDVILFIMLAVGAIVILIFLIFYKRPVPLPAPPLMSPQPAVPPPLPPRAE